MIHHSVSDLPGLLLLVVLAIHSAVDHQTKWAKSRQVGYPRNGLLMNTKDLQSSCLWVRHFDHFGASWKAVSMNSMNIFFFIFFIYFFYQLAKNSIHPFNLFTKLLISSASSFYFRFRTCCFVFLCLQRPVCHLLAWLLWLMVTHCPWYCDPNVIDGKQLHITFRFI